ncbi:tripartite tricarboxylate transporter TctB family protein [Aliiruegeria haliotis]|uniref:Tripartite tricarboxylate transporter TctB family protein n=1 Tax=Aliiruegeria haliotis TaxID=1280846 RepID=A0A2T0RFG6_9RHOB|nr:tripartite tricarboxylate transporter TctB family protein [Aliiruegeria haliotis]PRY19954.1 tripartite tricarboxylate transporter TctB family protein [Aliiruegeria haliotis]
MKNWLTAPDRALAIVVILVGAFLYLETYSFPSTDWEQLGVAFWPRLVLIGLGVLALFMVWKGTLEPGEEVTFCGRSFVFLAGGLAYYFLLRSVGYLVLTPLFVFVFTAYLGSTDRRGLTVAALSAVLGTAAIYIVFHYGLLVEFPGGVLEAFGE